MKELLSHQSAFIHGANSSSVLGGGAGRVPLSSSRGDAALNPQAMQTVVDPFLGQQGVFDHHVRQNSGDSGLGNNKW